MTVRVAAREGSDPVRIRTPNLTEMVRKRTVLEGSPPDGVSCVWVISHQEEAYGRAQA